MFAQISTEKVAEGFGLPAAIVIIALVTALIFTVRLVLKAYDKIDSLQEQRIADAKETRDGIMEPFKEQTKLTEQIYDIIIRNQGK